ncbi:MAG: prepilin-type N-terminal cleavage/methylation domain-containing protein [Candidatus Omnitrophica bacterium]|nr:prepilin-type N-terminal cleavage/methylation domain-containing protein [Candidatus Omnitrophota bacterium]
MSNKKGFLLLEVIVSIVIITSGLLFVMRVYSTARYAIQRSSVLFESGLLLESKMFEFEEKGEIEKDLKDGKQFSRESGYSWSIKTEEAPKDPVLEQKLDLDIVTLEVSRHRDKEERKSYLSKYFLTTYLNDKKNR